MRYGFELPTFDLRGYPSHLVDVWVFPEGPDSDGVFPWDARGGDTDLLQPRIEQRPRRG